MVETTCLEQRSDEARDNHLVRSDYNIEDQYSESHKDALADGDSRGKGTGSTGHGDSQPDCTKPVNVFDYSNFDTNISSNAGNNADNKARTGAMVKSKYTPVQPYGDVKIGSHEGQYFVP